MDEFGAKREQENRSDAVTTLLYIMNAEMCKPCDKDMNVELIDKCVEFIPQLNDEFTPPEEEKERIIGDLLRTYEAGRRENAASADDGKKTGCLPRIRISSAPSPAASAIAQPASA